MEDIIYGLNPVLSALQGKRRPTRVFISETLKNHDVEKICRENGIPFLFKTRREMDRLTGGANNQGVLCFVPAFQYLTLKELIGKTAAGAETLLLVLDGVEDPVNFGSLLRTACCFGADGIIIGKDRQVGMTPTVIKLSTGASEHIDICQVSNIAQTVSELKKNGFWIVAADGSGDRLFNEIDYGGKIVIIIGSEGRGVSRLVLERSDFVARIPLTGPITSLNAAVAGAIFLSAAASDRLKRSK